MSEEVKDIALNPDEGIEAQIAKALQPYKQQLAVKEQEAANLRKLAAEKDAAARKAQGDAQNAGIYAMHTEHLAIANKLAETEALISQLKNQTKLAVETADGTAAADISEKLGELTAQRLMLKQGSDRLREEIDAERRRADEAAKRPPPPRQLSVDEKINQLPPVQREFMRKHRDKYLDANGAPTQQLMAAYQAAIAAGYREDSPQLVAHMDKSLGHTQADEAPAADASERFVEVPPEAPKARPAPQAPPGRRAIPAAPVSRDAASGGSVRTNSKSFRLTGEQAQVAERMGMSHQEYRKFQEVAVARGKLPASVLNQ